MPLYVGLTASMEWLYVMHELFAAKSSSPEDGQMVNGDVRGGMVQQWRGCPPYGWRGRACGDENPQIGGGGGGVDGMPEKDGRTRCHGGSG